MKMPLTELCYLVPAVVNYVILSLLLQVVVVDHEHNLITTTEEIPPLPEPEYSSLRSEIMKLSHPNVFGIDHMKGGFFTEQYPRVGSRLWEEDDDLHFR